MVWSGTRFVQGRPRLDQGRSEGRLEVLDPRRMVADGLPGVDEIEVAALDRRVRLELTPPPPIANEFARTLVGPAGNASMA